MGIGTNYLRSPLVPSLSFDWLNNNNLTSLEGYVLNFARNSSSTYFGSDGLLKTASNNEARFEYDSFTKIKMGLKIESSATNICKYSNDYTNNYWSKTDLNVVFTNETLGIRGNTNEACKITEGITGNAILTMGNESITANSNYSVYHIIKKGNFDWIRIRHLDANTSSNGANCWFNLTTGQTGSISLLGTGNNYITRIKALHNGYYLCHVAGNIGGGFNSITTHIVSATNNGFTARVNNGFYYICGTQVEIGQTDTSFIPTSSIALTRSSDIPSMPIGQWYNNLEGSVIGKGYLNKPVGSSGVNSGFFSITDNSTSNGINCFIQSSANLTRLLVKTLGVSQADIGISSSPNSQWTNLAYGWKLDDFSHSRDSLPFVTDTIGTIPGVNILYVGAIDAGTFQMNGYIQSLRYYNRKLDNNTLRTLTA